MAVINPSLIPTHENKYRMVARSQKIVIKRNQTYDKRRKLI